MKKKWLLALLLLLIIPTGCDTTIQGNDVYTTVYPIEYIATRLYGNQATIKSIYPDGVNPTSYELNDKQIATYSKNTYIFIFNGQSNEKNYVIPMFNYNSDIKIIDASMSMNYDYSEVEFWLNPSDFLMMAQNIRNGLEEYTDNHYIITDIDANYDELKIDISNLDAELKLIANSATHKTLIVGNNALTFLNKYGFDVISLEESDDLTEKTIVKAINLIKNGTNQSVFVLDNTEETDTIKRLVNAGAKVVYLDSLANLTTEEREAKEDYIKIMNDNMDLIKEELYN